MATSLVFFPWNSPGTSDTDSEEAAAGAGFCSSFSSIDRKTEGEDTGIDGRAAVGFELELQLVGGSLDGHTSAVETEGEESVLSLKSVVTSGELGLGDGVGVTEVEHAVHVREGEGSHETRLEQGDRG